MAARRPVAGSAAGPATTLRALGDGVRLEGAAGRRGGAPGLADTWSIGHTTAGDERAPRAPSVLRLRGSSAAVVCRADTW